MKIKMDEYKSETSSYIDMKLLTLNSNKSPTYYDQPSSDLIKLSLTRSPEIYSCIKIHQTYIVHDPIRRHPN